ncbi:hypothetical protein TELCIR_08662 [Teladorsagia circumcincta]|uniref:Major facilitator superfamily (MFS) profile domain-containing protein n=1 Tax=Teladorsagia circumcincta TaxID=45464 RepID=A0A2G9UGX7_TELCI|nr:hypothetical protein TELCIR_08662 [Teladorsagia circumcincta]
MLSSVGFNSPLYFLPLHAQKGVGLDSAHSSAVLSAFGLSNSIGRLVYGIIADHKLPLPYGWGSDVARNRLWMYNISLSGIGTVAGPPIAGYLADITNSYVWSFVFSGINLLVSGLMLFSIPHIQRKRKRGVYLFNRHSCIKLGRRNKEEMFVLDAVYDGRSHGGDTTVRIRPPNNGTFDTSQCIDVRAWTVDHTFFVATYVKTSKNCIAYNLRAMSEQ